MKFKGHMKVVPDVAHWGTFRNADGTADASRLGLLLGFADCASPVSCRKSAPAAPWHMADVAVVRGSGK